MVYTLFSKKKLGTHSSAPVQQCSVRVNVTVLFIIWKGNSDRIPDVVAQRTSRVHPVNSAMIPSVEDAIQIYMNAGGTITRDSSFGIDPLASSDALISQRETEFIRNNPTFQEIYSNVINEDGSLMASAVLSFINITRNLSPWLFWTELNPTTTW